MNSREREAARRAWEQYQREPLRWAHHQPETVDRTDPSVMLPKLQADGICSGFEQEECVLVTNVIKRRKTSRRGRRVVIERVTGPLRQYVDLVLN